jgi:hypothetical protein
VAHRRGLVLDGSHALRLLVYGAYGIPLQTGFSAEHALLLSRGVVLAWAHVRGGGELGPPWHQAACHGNKEVSTATGGSCEPLRYGGGFGWEIAQRGRFTTRRRVPSTRL